MPTTITRYKVFLASPSDLSDDRTALDEVITELNQSFGQQNDLHIELLKWESHSAPGVSTINVQKIINKDLGSDYDLFIGLIWKKFGTPTDVAESGTEEEFLLAYKRFIENPNSVQILFYFKNSPIPIEEIVPEQIQKIQKFKADIGKNKNLLYWEYQDIQQLQKFIRIHLPQRILDIKKSYNDNSVTEIIEEVLPAEIIYEEELGIFDYEDLITEFLNESVNSLTKISEAITWVGDQMNKKTNEIENLVKSPNLGRNQIKDIFSRTAKIMQNFAKRIEPEIPIFYENFEKAMDYNSGLINLYKDQLDHDNLEKINTSLSGLISQMEFSIINTEEFLQSVKDLPKLAKDLNAARQNVTTKLDSLLTNLRVSLSIAVELQKSSKE